MMQQIPFGLYRVFNDIKRGFKGNISVVLHLKNEIPLEKMHEIAEDFQQPATTFLVGEKGKYKIWWINQDARIQLCGHGAAAAIAYLKSQNINDPQFDYEYGEISGIPSNDNSIAFQVERPTILEELPISDGLKKGLGINILHHYKTSNKNLVVVKSEEDIKKMKPNFHLLRTLEHFGYIVTAPGKNSDFVSRTLVPKVYALEDYATGSSHAVLTAYWGMETGRKSLTGHQLSSRGGLFHCTMEDNHVILNGSFMCMARGEIQLQIP